MYTKWLMPTVPSLISRDSNMVRESAGNCPLGYECAAPQDCAQVGVLLGGVNDFDYAERKGLTVERDGDSTVVYICEGMIMRDPNTQADIVTNMFSGKAGTETFIRAIEHAKSVGRQSNANSNS